MRGGWGRDIIQDETTVTLLQCAKGKSPRDEMKNNGESSKCTYRSCVYKLA